MSKPGRRQSEIWGQAAFYAGLGFILPGGLAVGYFFGWISWRKGKRGTTSGSALIPEAEEVGLRASEMRIRNAAQRDHSGAGPG